MRQQTAAGEGEFWGQAGWAPSLSLLAPLQNHVESPFPTPLSTQGGGNGSKPAEARVLVHREMGRVVKSPTAGHEGWGCTTQCPWEGEGPREPACPSARASPQLDGTRLAGEFSGPGSEAVGEPGPKEAPAGGQGRGWGSGGRGRVPGSAPSLALGASLQI